MENDVERAKVSSSSAEEYEEAYERAARYLVLTNGGGAVAMSAFLGTTISSHRATWWAALPLFCFYLGVICAGIIVFGQLLYRWKMLVPDPKARQVMVNRSLLLRVIDRWTEPPLCIMAASYGFFVLGGFGAGAAYLAMYWAKN